LYARVLTLAEMIGSDDGFSVVILYTIGAGNWRWTLTNFPSASLEHPDTFTILGFQLVIIDDFVADTSGIDFARSNCGFAFIAHDIVNGFAISLQASSTLENVIDSSSDQRFLIFTSCSFSLLIVDGTGTSNLMRRSLGHTLTVNILEPFLGNYAISCLLVAFSNRSGCSFAGDCFPGDLSFKGTISMDQFVNPLSGEEDSFLANCSRSIQMCAEAILASGSLLWMTFATASPEFM
jgi:hypothetical protein